MRKLARLSRSLLLLTLLVVLGPETSWTQVNPAGAWRTIHSPHFRVHYRVGAEAVAMHATAEAERAYTMLSTELVKPRQSIELVLSDAADFSNGAASVFPFNSIVLLLTPPLSEPDLQNYDDWIRLVLQHELTHIFHLDRVKGPWGMVQSILGRVPGTFPNLYQPSWVVEGLAVYYESRFTGRGREPGSFHTEVLLAAARAHQWPSPNEATYLTEKWPDGIKPYAFGSRFFERVAVSAGDSSIPRFIEAASGQWIPFRTGHPLGKSTGLRRDSLWRAVEQSYDSLGRTRPESSAETIDSALRAQPSPAVGDDGSLAWFASRSDAAPTIEVRRPLGEPKHYLATAAVDLAWSADTLYAAWLDLTDPLTYRSDLHRLVDGHWSELTRGKRLTDIAAGNGRIVGVQVGGEGNRLVVVSGDSTIPLTQDPPGTNWASPAWHPGSRVVAVEHDTGGYRLTAVDPETGREVSLVSSTGNAVLADPAWSRDDDFLFYVSDATGLPQVYAYGPTQESRQITDETMGATQPVPAPDGWLYFTVLNANGYALKRIRWGDRTAGPTPGVISPLVSPPQIDESASAAPPFRQSGYDFWPALRPHYFIPYAVDKGSAGLFLGALTTGNDPIGRVAYGAQLAAGLNGGRVDAMLSVAYQPWTHHAVDLNLSQRNGDAGILTAPVFATVRSRKRVAELGFTTTWRRWYRALSVRLATDYERDSFFSRPALRFFDPEFIAASIGTSLGRTLHPPLAISSEDGATLSLRYRRRWRLDQAGWSDEWRGRFAAYLAFKGLGTFAHPVLAARLAAATASGPDRETFGVGGASGIAYQVVPGIGAGSSRQFPVRGYEPGEIRGRTVAVGTAELRVPVALVAAPFGGLPYGLDRLSLRLFYDYGRAWDPPFGGRPSQIQSLGVELTWDLVVLYDVPLRLRTGVALPLSAGSATRRGDVRFGVGFGSEF